jgi:hypothetical protein
MHIFGPAISTLNPMTLLQMDLTSVEREQFLHRTQVLKEATFWAARQFSGPGVLGKGPVKCVVEIAEDFNSAFTLSFTKGLKHSSESKSLVTGSQQKPGES